MDLALDLAAEAAAAGEAPVGAVIMEGDRILAAERNRMRQLADPTAHAELQAIRAALATRGTGRLDGCDLYVTLEPCAMCAMALVHARVKRVVYAAADPKTGACGSVFDLLSDPRHNHKVEVQGGLLAEEAGNRLSAYFKAKRRSV